MNLAKWSWASHTVSLLYSYYELIIKDKRLMNASLSSLKEGWNQNEISLLNKNTGSIRSIPGCRINLWKITRMCRSFPILILVGLHSVQCKFLNGMYQYKLKIISRIHGIVSEFDMMQVVLFSVFADSSFFPVLGSEGQPTTPPPFLSDVSRTWPARLLSWEVKKG